MIKAVFFDYDGLILDTESASYEAWSRIYNSFGLCLTLNLWRKAIGNYEYFDPKTDLENKLGRLVGDVYREKFIIQKKLIKNLPLRKGVEKFIDKLISLKIKVVIVSNASEEWILHGLEQRNMLRKIHKIISKESVKKHKPHPEIYQKALKSLKISAEEAIAFEDWNPA